MSEVLARAAQQFPAEPAIVTPDEVLSYKALDARVDEMADRLCAAGLVAGSRCCTVLSATVDHVVLLLAGLRSGALVAPLNPRWPVSLKDEAIAALRPDCIVVETTDSTDERATCTVPELMAFVASEKSETPAPGTIAIHTSGSQGRPKAAVLTESNLVHNARLSNQNIPVQPGDRWLLSLPLYHVSGLGAIYRCLVGGGAVAIPNGRLPLSQAMAALRVTHISLVPKQLRELLDDDVAVERLRRLKVVLLGGGPIPEALLQHSEAAGIPIAITYGLTEMASQVATTSPRKLHDRSAPVLDADAVQLAPDGEIRVRGHALFSGYLEQGGLRLPLTPDGWFATGDLGEWVEPGRLRVLGRRDNRFKSMGEWVSPEQVETELMGILDIIDAVVVPVPHESLGHVSVAIVQTVSEANLDERAVRNSLCERLPGYMIPEAYVPWPADQRGGLKPDRAAFQRYAEEKGDFGSSS